MKVKHLSISVSSVFLLLSLSICVHGDVHNVYYGRASPISAETAKVILQNGTAGTSTIYTNSTSAKVSVEAPTYDYVDNNTSDIDSSADKGTHSNFTAQQYGPDSINDTLTEENAGSSGILDLYVNSFDAVKDQWAKTGTSPYLDAQDEPNNLVYGEQWGDGSCNGDLIGDFGFTNSSETSAINSVKLRVYGHANPNTGSGGANDCYFSVHLWNGSSWTEVMDFQGEQTYVWKEVDVSPYLDTWGKINSAKIYLQYEDPKWYDQGQQECDAALLRVNYTSTNYELDLEVQWTNVDYTLLNEKLCIYTGSTDAEDIQVDVWNTTTSTWDNVFTDLNASSWNNASVTSWLTSSNFTVRFKGGTETGDATQSSWNIDATLLHVWSEGTYDYVLRVNNTGTDSWQIRLKKYSDSSISRLQNCTIYFHNSTDGTSSQIVIENGSYTNHTGPWYDLGNSETIYIAMAVEANSTGTSHVYAYLEILIPNTTTYYECVITFEIT